MTKSSALEVLAARDDVAARAEALEAFSAEEILQAAIGAFGADLIVGTAFGAGGLCVLHMAQQIDANVQAYYLDTGFVFEQTRNVIQAWKDERKLNLTSVLPILSPSQQAETHGDKLWEREPDKCCDIRKVEPNRRILSTKRAWVTALRRDEASSRRQTPILSEVELPNGHRLLKICPIVSWSRKDVWRYIFAHELPYNALHDQGYPSIGCTHCTHAVTDGEDERAGRWSGSAKVECGLHTADADNG